MTGTVGENRQHGEANEYRWKAFEEEDPLPAREPIGAVESEQPRTDRVADRAGEGTAIMKRASARPRCTAGNHSLR